MIYKGFTIYADVNVNEQWDIDETDNGEATLSAYRDSGGPDDDNIVDFLIEDEDGYLPSWANEYYDTLQAAKDAIDNRNA